MSVSLRQAKIAVFGELGRLVRYLESGEELTFSQTIKLKARIEELEKDADLLAQIAVGKQTTKCYQYRTNGELVREHPSIEVAAAYCGISTTGLRQCIKRHTLTYKGFMWKLEGDSAAIDVDSMRHKFKSMTKYYLEEIHKAAEAGEENKWLDCVKIDVDYADGSWKNESTKVKEEEYG
jgi:hypothetical protein